MVLSPQNEAAIHAEYGRLLGFFGLTSVTLDIYEHDPDSAVLTKHGTPLAEGNPGFSPSLGKIWVAGDPW